MRTRRSPARGRTRADWLAADCDRRADRGRSSRSRSSLICSTQRGLSRRSSGSPAARPCPRSPRRRRRRGRRARGRRSARAPREASRRRAAGVGDQPVRGPRRHPQPALDLRRGLARSSACATSMRGAHPLGHPVEQARDALTLGPQRQIDARRRLRRRRPPARRPATMPCARPTAPSAPRSRPTSTLAPARPPERQLLELAQQPLLAVADVLGSAPGRRRARAAGRARARARSPTSAAPTA